MSPVSSSQTLQKLSGMFHLPSENWPEVDFSRWGSCASDREKFELLKSAIIHCNCVKIHYANSCQVTGDRIVQPAKLIYKANAWYLNAFCTKKQDWRLFKLNRILALEVLKERFSHCDSPLPADSSEGEYQQITLRFPKEMTYRVYDEFSPEQELSTPFDFSNDEKKKEAHWKRDRNLRDVLIHLYEWHQLLLHWVQSNQEGDSKPFLPQPYNWKACAA